MKFIPYYAIACVIFGVLLNKPGFCFAGTVSALVYIYGTMKGLS